MGFNKGMSASKVSPVPIAYASEALSSSESNYAQRKRIFEMKRFH